MKKKTIWNVMCVQCVNINDLLTHWKLSLWSASGHFCWKLQFAYRCGASKSKTIKLNKLLNNSGNEKNWNHHNADSSNWKCITHPTNVHQLRTWNNCKFNDNGSDMMWYGLSWSNKKNWQEKSIQIIVFFLFRIKTNSIVVNRNTID